ncbi:glycoside hydrolase family 113 [Dokdonia sp. Hel_I_53]|uniref:glycoside hydrolase family 113 n=1 Tax=Dokdonia sp. Hel_I_53 TaxID=1566287 RepID=UPI00119B6C24|nr:glycoside hydrolase [Dokdonia sp. Hel_I_53]TVZ53065.1 hypothetical protein OD90_2257 [Dokdonia sp. Hel_I_53]
MKVLSNGVSFKEKVSKVNLIIKTFIFILLCSCSAQPVPEMKIKGVSFVANRSPVDSTHVKPVKDLHANYAAVMPFGFIPEKDAPQIVYNTDRQWYGETKEGGRNYITQLHKGNINVMMKPQLWIRHGEFTGYLKMRTEEDWLALEESYRVFIIEYAVLAQEENTAIFCIGTELENFVSNRPEFWKQLIIDIRKIYNGKLTYAANWDEYKRTPFWNQLDFIGVDAYFPVCDEETPSVACAREGWKKWGGELAAFAKAKDRKVIFTEFGYRSVDYTGREPWKADRSMTGVNLQGQANATQALLETVWQEEWMAGGFVWKWFIHHDEVGGEQNNQYTPQNKPAAEILRTYFERD